MFAYLNMVDDRLELGGTLCANRGTDVRWELPRMGLVRARFEPRSVAIGGNAMVQSNSEQPNPTGHECAAMSRVHSAEQRRWAPEPSAVVGRTGTWGEGVATGAVGFWRAADSEGESNAA